jgi:16S rRNA U516 pseudouridylate synthase RsuA-like enzyme
MKKCPKYHGRKVILNYIAIDGGTCYECNGKGEVSDGHTLYSSRNKFKLIPQWVKDRDEKVMQTAHEQRTEIKKRIRVILDCNGEAAEDVISLFDKPRDVIWEMSEEKFRKEVEMINEELKELMTV